MGGREHTQDCETPFCVAVTSFWLEIVLILFIFCYIIDIIFQALFRGHKARMLVAHDLRVAELRRRWREGALKSTQESLKERNEDAMEVLRNMSGIEMVIDAFRSLGECCFVHSP